MIVSHRHRLIFLKTRKTAGTSVELSLSRYCGPDDVITPVVPEDEPLRGEGPGPQHHLRPARAGELRLRGHGDVRRLATGRWPQRPRFWNHMTAAEGRAELGADVWDGYHSFCFARNPWDRLVSRLFWERHRRDRPDLTVDEVIEMFPPEENWLAYTIDGVVAVDRVYDMRELEPGVREALAHVGIEFDGWLPRAKDGTGRAGAGHRDVLEPRHIELVAERCAGEIALMGYEP